MLYRIYSKILLEREKKFQCFLLFYYKKILNKFNNKKRVKRTFQLTFK